MNIDTTTMISITEANQNFSKVAKMVEQNGNAIILKNNKPRFVVIDFEAMEALLGSEGTLRSLSDAIIKKNKAIYEELAK